MWIRGKGTPDILDGMRSMSKNIINYCSMRGNVGWIGVFGRCPTLHQSRVQPDGILRSLPSGSYFLYEIFPQEIESRCWIFALGDLLGCELN